MAVMAKAPRAGAVKTRLAPLLSPSGTEALSAAFLLDISATIHVAARAASIAPFIAYAPAGAEAHLAHAIAPGTELILADGELIAEPGISGIGRSLLQATRNLLALGYAGVALVSADSPTLPAEFLVQAAHALTRPGDRMVLGPAEDGGYYLIGLRRPHADIFRDITWSTSEVAEETQSRAARLGLEVLTLPLWYDVDDPVSLARMAGALAAGRERAPATASCLARFGLLAGAQG